MHKVGHRNPFLWNWCRRGVEITMLSCVEPSLEDAVCDTRVLGIMLDVLLDDIADHHKDLAFLEQLLGVMETGVRPDASAFATHQQAYAVFTMDVWDEIQRRIRQFPRYKEFAELLRFDYRQLFNVMRYSRLLNEYPEMFNLVDHDLYTPHNMHMMISATMDLMCSPAFDRAELAILREIVWRAQCMGRIGNLVTTWQREIGENDFTSGVFARAITSGDLSVSDLWSGNRDYLESVIKRQEHEEFFLRRWQSHRREILAMRARSRTVNFTKLVAGLQLIDLPALWAAAARNEMVSIGPALTWPRLFEALKEPTVKLRLSEKYLQRFGHHYVLLMMIATRLCGCTGGLLVVFYTILTLRLSDALLFHFFASALVLTAESATATVFIALWELRHVRRVLKRIELGQPLDADEARRAGR